MVRSKTVSKVALAIFFLTALAARAVWGASAIAPLTPEEEKIAADLLRAPSAPAVPDENNAALIYRQLFESAKADYFSKDKWETFNAALGGQTPALESGLPEPIPLETKGGAKNKTPYQLLHKVEGMDCNFGIDWSEGHMTQLPHLPGMRALGRVLALQAVFDSQQGRRERALKHIRLIFTLSQHVSEEPTTSPYVVALGLERMGRWALMDAAFERRDDPEFLQLAAELLRSKPKRRKSAADAIRGECRAFASYYVRLAADPGKTADDFKAVYGDIVWSGFRHTVGVPLDSLDDDALRTFGKRTAVFYWLQTDRFARALESGGAAGLAAKKEIEEKRKGEWRKMPEGMLACFLMPAFGSSIFLKAPPWDEAAIAVFEARARGDREIGTIADPLGKPYKVTWSDDIVHFESPSQWYEPHDLDVFVGRYDDYVKLRERLEREGARKSGT